MVSKVQSNSQNERKHLTFSLVVFVDVVTNSPLCHRCVVVLDKCGIRTTLVVPVANGEDVGPVGLVWVNVPDFNVPTEVCFQFHPPLWAEGRHGCFMGERETDERWMQARAGVCAVCDSMGPLVIF